MGFQNWLVTKALKLITHLICRIDASELKKIPQKGPLILAANHVNILEIPIIYTQLRPRPIRGMVLASRWETPFLRWLLDVCDAIPLHRGEPDIAAIRKGLKALANQEILIIAPEGTRSGDGHLQAGHPGVVSLAVHGKAPIIPIAYHGSENYKSDLRHLRRSKFKIFVGDPFYLDPGSQPLTRQIRNEMLAMIMDQIASLLPNELRGYYSSSNPGNSDNISHPPQS